MYVLSPVKLNPFYSSVEKLCFEAGLPYCSSVFSKKMYGNIVLAFLVVYKERLNVSYRRLVEIAKENHLERSLGVKRIPHFTTLQKFVQRVKKNVLLKLLKACRTLLSLKDIESCIDGTGFSNTNPSHYYQKRVDGVKVKNYTKAVIITDNKSKLILNIETHSDHSHETKDFIPLVRELKNDLKCILADKAYDSMENRNYCWKNDIDVHIPFREWKQFRKNYGHVPHFKKPQRLAIEKFDPEKYRYRVIIESVNSAIKRTLGGWVCSRKPENQQKQVILKAIAYNIEKIGRTIKLTILSLKTTFLQSLYFKKN